MSRHLPCAAAAVALSASLDGELGPTERADLDAHLVGCAACRARAASLQAMSRRSRLHVAPVVPDLADAVVAARAAEPARVPWSPARSGLVLVGVAQLLLSLPALLLGGDVAASLHVTREAAVTELAVAVGVLSAAWRPWRAAGMLPVVGVLALGLAVTSTVDIASGRVPAAAEVVHLLPLAGALLLWQLRHRDPIAPHPTSGSRRDDLRRSA